MFKGGQLIWPPFFRHSAPASPARYKFVQLAKKCIFAPALDLPTGPELAKPFV
ncbi:hypothetical protein LEM8419_02271 [Neolewinella maritima]|uniref:Uncharacterized protein n=1 Tax=Neolewinella maritima TaxID=1383882 RepID=A0ABM9B2J2_9BACT|nr:hypothetical protein LEM8419_02271 [Neolewinella maritima]